MAKIALGSRHNPLNEKDQRPVPVTGAKCAREGLSVSGWSVLVDFGESFGGITLGCTMNQAFSVRSLFVL
jgi:hypothetical protein